MRLNKFERVSIAILIASALLFALALAKAARADHGQPHGSEQRMFCGDIVQIEQSLARGYGETPLFAATTEKGAILRFYVNAERRSWTAFKMIPGQSIACYLASGTEFTVPQPPRGEPL